MPAPRLTLFRRLFHYLISNLTPLKRLLTYLHIRTLPVLPPAWFWSPNFRHQYLHPKTGREDPEPVPGLTAAPHPSSWPLPSLAGGAQLVKLHVFSMATPKCRRRRELIREQNWRRALPEGYEGLVEVKFVVARPWEETHGRGITEREVREILSQLKAEQDEYGDILYVDMEENMNQGKTTAWIRQVGRVNEGEKEALWVFKVDDDSIVLVQNLLDILVRLDPAVPTYIGKPWRNWEYSHSYMVGGFYGFSWGVAKTIAAADMSDYELRFNRPEDARTGTLMHLLPNKPSPACLSAASMACGFPLITDVALPTRIASTMQTCLKNLSLLPLLGLLRLSDAASVVRPLFPGGPLLAVPDARTGLQRVILHGFFGDDGEYGLKPLHQMVALHYLKEEDKFARRWEEAQDALRAQGRGEWEVPGELACLL